MKKMIFSIFLFGVIPIVEVDKIEARLGESVIIKKDTLVIINYSIFKN